MKGRRRIIFRADGNSQVGLGHVVRSLALAAMLRGEYECVFAIQVPAKELQEQIRQVCDGLIVLPRCLPSEERFVHELDAYVSEEEIVVLDGYGFGTEYQESIKAKGAQLVCIDDIHAYRFVADVVINHGTHDPEPYKAAYYTKLLLGPRYALLRQAFLRQPRSNKKRDGLLLCFGGSDVHNLTRRYLEVIAGRGNIGHVEVVVGSAYLHYQELLEFVQQHKDVKQINVHQNLAADKLARIMAACSVAVVPGSSIALECASMGIKLISGYYTDNQKGLLEVLKKCGAAVDAGNMLELEPHKLNEAISNQHANPQTGVARERLFGRQSPNKRLLKEFRRLDLAGQLQIRSASESDADVYYSWANDPATRASAVNQETIAYSSHVRWFEDKLKSEQSHLYLLSLGDVPVGQVRFDKVPSAYVIDYSVSPKHRALGLGRAIMARGVAQLKEDLNVTSLMLKAKVKASNTPSCKVFESLHFKLAGTEIIDGVLFQSFEISIIE